MVLLAPGWSLSQGQHSAGQHTVVREMTPYSSQQDKKQKLGCDLIMQRIDPDHEKEEQAIALVDSVHSTNTVKD